MAITMAKVYLLVVHHVDLGDGVDPMRTVARNRAFFSMAARETAAKRFIDEMLANFDILVVPATLRSEVQDCIDDMLYARQHADLSYEMGLCYDVFGMIVEFQDIIVELEELVGEVVN